MEQSKQAKNLPTVETLEAIGDAFNRHDLEGVMSFFADDGVFYSTSGPEAFGTRYEGREAVQAFFAGMFKHIPDIRFEATHNWVSGNMGCSQWHCTGTRPDGGRMDWWGLDVFTFRDGKVISKDSYFKQRT